MDRYINSIKDISEANYIDTYETGIENPETLEVKIIDQNEGSDFLETGEILKKSISDQFYQIVEKCNHSNPEFTLIKIFKKSKIEKIVFRKDDEIIDTLYFYRDNNLGVRIYDPSYYLWSILRFDYKKEDLENPSEYYLHKKGSESHQKEIKEINFEQKCQSLVNKNFIDSELENPNSEITGSNLLTREFQLFYMGNLMHDNKEFRSNEE